MPDQLKRAIDYPGQGRAKHYFPALIGLAAEHGAFMQGSLGP
jgi:hypothetical protein